MKHADRVRRLVLHLEGDLVPPAAPALEDARWVPGWQVLHGAGRTWCIWIPGSRNKVVPWALGPPTTTLKNSRALYAYLQKHWLPQAREWLATLPAETIEVTPLPTPRRRSYSPPMASHEAVVLRSKLALDLDGFAAAVGVKPDTVVRWERGERDPGAHAQRRLRALERRLP